MISKINSLRARKRSVIEDPAQLEDKQFRSIVDYWHSKPLNQNGLPDFKNFDIVELPGLIWSKLFLVKLFGSPRRFFYELVGGDIEEHNGFSAQKKFLTDLPLKNRHAMAIEFVHTLHAKKPVISVGPYIGAADYVKTVSRVICPFDMGNQAFAFLGIVRFENYSPEELQKIKLANKKTIPIGAAI